MGIARKPEKRSSHDTAVRSTTTRLHAPLGMPPGMRLRLSCTFAARKPDAPSPFRKSRRDDCPALPAAHAAAPLCPATPSPQPAAWVAHINEVNHGLGIPGDYAVKHNLHPQPEAKDLVQVPRDVYGRKVEMVAPAASALKRMFAAAARDGVKLETVSGFRSINYQTGLIRRKLKSGMGIQKALTINAVPGYSEHQTGCAVDLTTPGVPAADGSFARSKAFAW